MKRLLFALAGLMAAHVAEAQATDAQAMVRLETQMYVEKVATDLNGRPRRTLESADRLTPGDRVIVILHWRNQGAAPIRDFTAARSVLRGTTPDLRDPAVQVSIDGGRHWARFDQLWLPTQLGGVRRAVAEDVTHVRWQLPDNAFPGQSGRLSYRATIQ